MKISRNMLPKVAAVALLALVRVSGAASPGTFSLSGDWSNTNNPNGPWSYNRASSPLPLVADWTAGNSAFVGCNQPAWAPSNNPGDFLPALMKANSCTAKDSGTDPRNGQPNVVPGDIVVHTVDSFNGNPSLGVANFLFTLPAGQSGTYQISGFVWDASLYYGTSRPQDWELSVNGVKKQSGFLSGSVSRSQAETFNIVVDLTAGSTVDLELFKDPSSSAGFFVGANLSIGLVPCVLNDALSYSATSDSLTMKFTIGNNLGTAAIWNAWLTYADPQGTDPDTMQLLFSTSQPITNPPVTITKSSTGLPKEGKVGVLSTLSTPQNGIACSSWVQVDTGTDPLSP